jgi:hypothetical protein
LYNLDIKIKDLFPRYKTQQSLLRVAMPKTKKDDGILLSKPKTKTKNIHTIRNHVHTTKTIHIPKIYIYKFLISHLLFSDILF